MLADSPAAHVYPQNFAAQSSGPRHALPHPIRAAHESPPDSGGLCSCGAWLSPGFCCARFRAPACSSTPPFVMRTNRPLTQGAVFMRGMAIAKNFLRKVPGPTGALRFLRPLRTLHPDSRLPTPESRVPSPVPIQYTPGSPSGRVLKRLCAHRYCAGAARTMVSISALMRAVSCTASGPGKSTRGSAMRIA